MQYESKNYIVVSVGKGVWTSGYVDKLVYFLEQNCEALPDKIIVEENLSIHKKIPWSEKKIEYKRFSLDVLKHAEAIVGRPSVGIVTDALSLGVPFFPIFDEEDQESLHNASALNMLYLKMGVGLNFLNRLKVRQTLSNKKIPGFGGEEELLRLVNSMGEGI